MKISCVQMNMEFAAPGKNFEKAHALIRRAAKEKPDVILLPETWNTGFFPQENLPQLCDVDGARIKKEIGGLAAELCVNIVAGSVSNLKSGAVYNTSYCFDRNGICIAEYDKTHLFTPMNEDKYYSKGSGTCCFEVDGKRCGIIICYDVRFPELTRTMSVKGLDFLFVVSQWPAVRTEHLLTLTKARAIENQMFVACCNSCGSAKGTVYGGNSIIFDPWGKTLAHADAGEDIISADCDESILSEIRSTINVFADRRPKIYNIN